jgi:hypothetical protein
MPTRQTEIQRLNAFIAQTYARGTCILAAVIAACMSANNHVSGWWAFLIVAVLLMARF